jgi:anti-sigma B factor antagonist
MTGEPLTFAKLGTADVVQVTGEIDLANAPRIGREIVRNTGRAAALLIDLTAVSFLDSAGVRLLDALVGDLDRQGTPIRLIVAESGAARMTLRLCAFRDDLLATDLARAAEDLAR